MPDAFLIAASQGQLAAFSGQPHAGQVAPTVKTLLEKTGLPAAEIQELQWHGGDEEFWLSSLAQNLGFRPSMARFHWPTTPMLVHFALQSAARALQSGEREVMLMAQEVGEQVIVLLLASSTAASRLNLSPRARLSHCLVLSSAPDGLLASARAALKEKIDPPVEVGLLASSRHLSGPQGAPSAGRWLAPDKDTPAGDLFLLEALVRQMESAQSQYGLLLSEGSQRSGLVTLVGR